LAKTRETPKDANSQTIVAPEPKDDGQTPRNDNNKRQQQKTTTKNNSKDNSKDNSKNN